MNANQMIPLRSEAQRAKIAPKVFIFAMFDEEAANWLFEDSAFDFSHKFTMAGLSRGYEEVRCTSDYAVCLVILGTALINAALSTQTIVSSPIFDLTKTYFLLTGIAGVNPKLGTIGAVTFAKYAIQVDTQLEFDGREAPSNWNSGYAPMGADHPNDFPKILQGSEIYELNENLRQIAISFAQNVALEDSTAAQELRDLYSKSPNDIYHAATLPPSILNGDVASGNVFWQGKLLCEGMEHTFKIYTNCKAEYVMSAQEYTAIITALMRAALQERVDFSRIILTRAGSNFDRGPLNDEKPTLPFEVGHEGMKISTRNLYLSGIQIVEGILEGWSNKFEMGITPTNYIGDVFGSLGGKPDFLPPPKYGRRTSNTRTPV